MKSKARNEEGIMKARQLWRDRQEAKRILREKNAIKRNKRTTKIQLNVISRRKGSSRKETVKLERVFLNEVSS